MYSKESSNEDLIKVFIKNITNDNKAREFFVFAEKAYVEGTAEESVNLKHPLPLLQPILHIDY